MFPSIKTKKGKKRMAPPRKKGRNKRVEDFHLKLQHPIAKKVHKDLASRGMASPFYEQYLLDRYARKLTAGQMTEALREELLLINEMEDEEIRRSVIMIKNRYGWMRELVEKQSHKLIEEQIERESKALLDGGQN